MSEAGMVALLQLIFMTGCKNEAITLQRSIRDEQELHRGANENIAVVNDTDNGDEAQQLEDTAAEPQVDRS